MKKLYVCMVVAVLVGVFSVSAWAVKQRTLSQTRISSVTVNLQWDDQTGTIVGATVIGSALILDSNGDPAGGASKTGNFSQLPPTIKTAVRTLVKFVARQINNDAVAEDVEPTMP